MSVADAPFVGYHAGHEQFTPSELVEQAVMAEDAGFDGFTVSDHLHPWQDNQGHAGHAWITLAAAGQRTSRIRLGTSITCPTYRYHPVQVAHAFASLACLYPGRVDLGVGTGEALNEAPAGGWVPYRERAERLVEAIRLMRRLWTEDWVDFGGRYYHVRAVNLYDKPPSPPPVYVAASGPRSARIAGAEADGWITDVGTARRAGPVREAFLDAARAAGKDPDAMPKIVELWAVVGDREEALAGAALWRFLPIFSDVVNVPDPRRVQRLAEERVSPERVIETWVVSPDPEPHATAIRELFELGFDRVLVHSPQRDQRSAIDFYGRRVLPALRR